MSERKSYLYQTRKNLFHLIYHINSILGSTCSKTLAKIITNSLPMNKINESHSTRCPFGDTCFFPGILKDKNWILNYFGKYFTSVFKMIHLKLCLYLFPYWQEKIMMLKMINNQLFLLLIYVYFIYSKEVEIIYNQSSSSDEMSRNMLQCISSSVHKIIFRQRILPWY